MIIKTKCIVILILKFFNFRTFSFFFGLDVGFGSLMKLDETYT